MQLDQIRAEDFEALLGSRMSLQTPSLALEAEVLALRRLPEHRLRASSPFSLVLRGGRDKVVAQGMVTLEHPQLGPLEVFLVPIGPDAQGLRYEITFN